MTKRRATPKYISPRQREYKPKPHPRQREIDSHPKPISMSGIGNGLNLGGREGK